MKQVLKNFFLFCAVFGGVVALAGVALLVYLVYYYSQDLPDHHQLANYAPPTVTRFYADDGKLLEEYAKEHRFYVPIADIPPQLIQAFIAAEDQNFYHHPGVDFLSVARAIVQNIIHIGQGKSLVGGSTITQQVVKNFLLTNERSLSRKIREAILSFRVTNVYSKDKILELYLNQIYLGMGAYGVTAAGQAYFNKTLAELTLPEIALLAAMPKAPSNYDPRFNLERARERRDWVLKRMEEEHYITNAEVVQATATDIVLRKRDRGQVVKADFFAEAVRQQIVDEYGKSMLYEGGLSVRTTLNPVLQSYADAAFRRGILAFDQKKGYRGPIAHLSTIDHWQEALATVERPEALEKWQLAVVLQVSADKASIGLDTGEKASLLKQDMLWTQTGFSSVKSLLKVGDVVAVEKITDPKEKPKYILRQIPAVNGAMVVMEPRTGKVLALIGGYHFGDSQFNRVTQAMRQTGSTFKTFVYLAALENGIPPNTMIDDGPIAISPGPGLPLWRPKNFKGDFLGLITMRKGLEKSRNLVTIRLGQMIGIKKIEEITKRFGLSEDPPSNPAMVLGTTETTVLAMTHAYSMIANGGVRTTPSLIERIQSREGKTLFRRDKRNCQYCQTLEAQAAPLQPSIEEKKEHVTDPRSAYQMISLLQGVVSRGTASNRAAKLGHHLAGKTGTTNGPNQSTLDTWFMGFSPDLMVGVFVGYDTPKNMGKSESGASVALPIFVDFMEQALKGKPDKAFTVPTGLTFLPIDESTGKIAPSSQVDNRHVIWEAFKVGTEPERDGEQGSDLSAETWQLSTPQEGTSVIPLEEATEHHLEAPAAVIPPAPKHAPLAAPKVPVGTGGIY